MKQLTELDVQTSLVTAMVAELHGALMDELPDLGCHLVCDGRVGQKLDAYAISLSATVSTKPRPNYGQNSEFRVNLTPATQIPLSAHENDSANISNEADNASFSLLFFLKNQYIIID